MRNGADLAGCRILVVEDNFLLAMEIEDVLRRAAASCSARPARDRAGAGAARRRAAPDAAVLDVDLQGRRVTPVAAALHARGVPYLLVTGYADPQLGDPELGAGPRLDKPVNGQQRLLGALGRLLRA